MTFCDLQESQSKRAFRTYPVLLLILLALYALLGWYFVRYGTINHDEGWYLYAAKLVYEGKRPYVDFAYFQCPLLPYIYGFPQKVFGGGILIGRLTSFVLGLVTVLLAAKLARRLAGDMAAVLAFAICCTTAIFFWVFSTTRTEPLVTALAMISLYFLLTGGKEPLASFLASSAMVWAAATRVSCLPAAACVFVFALYKNRAHRAKAALIFLLILLQIVILLGLPLMRSSEHVLFNVFTSQLQRHSQLKEAPALPPLVFWRHRLVEMLAYLGWYYPALFQAAITVGIFVLLQLGMRGLQCTLQQKGHYLALLGVAIVLYLPNVAVPENFQAVYFVPSACALAVLVSCALADLYYRFSQTATAHLVLASTLSLLILQSVFLTGLKSYYTSSSAPLQESELVARHVASLVPPHKQIATFDTYVALEANRTVAHGLEMDMFAFFPRFSDEEAQRYHVVNDHLFAQILHDERTACAIFTDFDLRMLVFRAWPWQEWEAPGHPLSEEELFEQVPALKGSYRLDRIFPQFGPFEDNLYLLVRTDSVQ